MSELVPQLCVPLDAEVTEATKRTNAPSHSAGFPSLQSWHAVHAK